MKKPFVLFLVAAALTTALATIVPAAIGSVEYDPILAVNLVMTIAVLATAFYAAANLSEFREAREAEYTPVLDLALRLVRERGLDKALEIRARNIGRGAAAGIEIAVWWTDKDLVMWLPRRVPLDSDLLLSGEATTSRLEFEGLHAVFQKHFKPNLPSLVVQLRYRDALLREVEVFRPYDLPSGEDDTLDLSILQPSPLPVPAELSSVEGKQRMLDEMLGLASEELGLTERGLSVEGTVSRQKIQAWVRLDDRELWRAQTGPGEGIFHFSEWLERAAPRILAQLDSEAEGESVSQSRGGDLDSSVEGGM